MSLPAPDFTPTPMPSGRNRGSGLLPRTWAQQWLLYSQPIRQRWLDLAPRERRGLRWGVGAVMVLSVITLGVRPAWRTLQETPGQLDLVEAQLRQMSQLASEAQMLRATPVVSMAKSIDALKAACDRLGAVANVTLQGQQATVVFNGVTPEALTEWLREVRVFGRVRVTEAKLSRTGTTYSGSVLIALGGTAP